MKRALQTVAIALLIASPLAAQDALSIDSEGRIWVTIHGSEPRLLEATISPVGSIQAYAFSEAPVGWLICNGDLIDKSINPEHGTLVDLLRAEAGSNTSHPYYHPDPNKAYLPDLRGRFARGLDAGSGRDPGALSPAADGDDRRIGMGGAEVGDVVGSVQDDAFQGHRHAEDYEIVHGGSFGAGNGYSGSNVGEVGDPVNDGTNGTPRTSSETRPQNVAVNYIIKY